jgi:hypothetical protein
VVAWVVTLLVIGTCPACTSVERDEGTPALPRKLADTTVGWSLRYPGAWSARGRVAATAFAAGARCRSAIVVDDPSAGATGPVGTELRTFVQVCARRRTDRLTLERSLRETYGSAFAAQFEETRLGGRPAFRTRRSTPALVFVQTGGFRIQLASSVSTESRLRAKRRSEVAAVLRSFELGEPRGEGSR